MSQNGSIVVDTLLADTQTDTDRYRDTDRHTHRHRDIRLQHKL